MIFNKVNDIEIKLGLETNSKSVFATFITVKVSFFLTGEKHEKSRSLIATYSVNNDPGNILMRRVQFLCLQCHLKQKCKDKKEKTQGKILYSQTFQQLSIVERWLLCCNFFYKAFTPGKKFGYKMLLYC